MIPHLSQFSALFSLPRHPHVTRDELVGFQNKQLRRLISHAYKNVPYYRKLFDRNGLNPQDIKTVADLPAIPVTTKKDLQGLPAEETVARGVDIRRLIVLKTSGSSGEPSIIRRTWLERRLLQLFRLRAMHYLGQKMSDKIATVLPTRPHDHRDNQLPLQILQALGLYRGIRIDCKLPPEDVTRRLWHFCPDVLSGYPGVLARIAEIIDDDDRQHICPRFISVGAEVLTPLMRHQITKAFAAPVFNLYGSLEFNLIAWECKETGELHTCDDSMILEILKDGHPVAMGERGEVVGTNLHSFTMPFIRYKLGDIVTKGSETCRCGQPFSTIRDIQGRMIDYFPLPGGGMIHPWEILEKVYSALWIRQYQLIQEREDRIILRVAPCTTPPIQEISLIEESGSSLLGQAVDFRVVLVPEIEFEPNGKFRVCHSFVKSAYEGIEWDNSQTTSPTNPGTTAHRPP